MISPIPSPSRDAVEQDALLSTWAHGWALSRGTPAPIPLAGFGFRVDIDEPGHLVRYLSTGRDGDALRALTQTLVEPGTWLKALAPHSLIRPLLEEKWSVQPPEYFMRLTFPEPATIDLQDGYRLDLKSEDQTLVATVQASNGERAASGRMAIHDGTAVFDQIRTRPEHRRRGLGRAVMQALQHEAIARRVSRGLLLASEAGHALYLTLGWQDQASATAAVIP